MAWSLSYLRKYDNFVNVENCRCSSDLSSKVLFKARRQWLRLLLRIAITVFSSGDWALPIMLPVHTGI